MLGLELATLTPQLAQRMELPESWRGALVLNVDAESPLAQHVQPRDVISAIDNQAIQSAEQAVEDPEPAGRSRPVDRSASTGSVKGKIERHTIRLP